MVIAAGVQTNVAELCQHSWVKVWACRDLFPKTDNRAALGTLILNLVQEQPISASE